MAQPTSFHQQHSSRRRKACDNCRRRKERCDGLQPCGRCRRRRVESQCQLRHSSFPPPHPPQSRRDLATASPPSSGGVREHAAAPTYNRQPFNNRQDWQGVGPNPGAPSRTIISRNLSISSPLCSMVSHMSRLIRDPQGTYIFLGPSANLSVVQSIRQIIHGALGTGYFTDVSAENDLVDDIPAVPMHRNETPMEPPRPSIADTRYYLQWYTSATSDVFDLFGYEELIAEIIPWLERASSTDSNTCINFLVLAIGAQCGPESRDEETDAYFNYARYLSSINSMESTTIVTVQIYCLITTYLLNAARPHAASMNLGLTIRAAYSLGIHRADINGLFPTTESFKRERIWKVLRVQDLFLSSTLGHHPSTTETRDTTSQQGYSASTDLCLIFEKILSQVYSKQEVSPTVLQNVSKHHREWACHFREGHAVYHIPAEDYVSSACGKKNLNIGLCHLKAAYYWTIMLVTRPYLIGLVERRLAIDSVNSPPLSIGNDMSTSMDSADALLAHASVNSAVLTIDLLRCLLDVDEIPKRLPYVVNSVLNSALVLGIAYFADLDRFFPLGHAMDTAERLLDRFQLNDALARWSLRIVRDLHNSCNQFVNKRCDRHLKQQGALVEGLFGHLNPLRSQDRPATPSRSPLCTSQGWNKSSEIRDLDGMIQAQLSEIPSKPPNDDANAIWDQLFCGSISGSHLEFDADPAALPFDQMPPMDIFNME